MKCVVSSSSFQYFSCPIRLIEELPINHPYHSLVIQTLQTFHNKYDGCSCKTLLFFLTTYFNYFHLLFDKNNHLCQKKIFNYLEQFIDQSKLIAEERFSENFYINSNIILRICRYQTIYSDSLYQAYLYFHSLNQQISHKELLTHFNNLNHITRVKYFEEKCLFIPGTILQINKSIQGYRRTILIDGHLLEDYVHIGYNNKIKLKQISTKSSWMYLVLSILKEYSIEIIICSGTVDQKLKECNDKIFIENIPVKTLRLLGQNSLLTYITDLNQEHILSLNYTEFPDDPLLTIIEKGSTIIQYVPLESLINIKHEQFLHCLARFRHILRKNIYLNGSSEFENQLYKYWYDKRENNNNNNSFENNLAYECFLECLQIFIKEIKNHHEYFEKNLIDDFDSKFDAWKTSIELLKILMQIDNIVKIVTNEDLSDI
ncbi:unnamed protein product [Adineta steineri]|uniref:Uncharacterized protein n=2 Tax=Adineta steineri TaxID=433720 RepID=A0A818W4T5_9BILA|nr:unnamed protein product [Adineta steineri]